MNNLLFYKQAFENGCFTFCLWLFMILGGVALLCASGAVKSLVDKWTRLGRFDKFVLVVGLALMVQIGATKNTWVRVKSDGADTIAGTTLLGVYTCQSNDVRVVEGVTVTNKIPMVRVAWTGSGITTNTPVQYRYADTNAWTIATKSNLVSGATGTTNWLEFVTSETIRSMPNWWVGTNTPPIVILTGDINLVSFTANGNGVTLVWTCTEERAKKFRIWNKLRTDADWTACGDEAEGLSRTIPGFFLDKEWYWRITSDFLEDGE